MGRDRDGDQVTDVVGPVVDTVGRGTSEVVDRDGVSTGGFVIATDAIEAAGGGELPRLETAEGVCRGAG